MYVGIAAKIFTFYHLPDKLSRKPATHSFLHHDIFYSARGASKAVASVAAGHSLEAMPVGTQPQRDMLGFHRLPDHSYQPVV